MTKEDIKRVAAGVFGMIILCGTPTATTILISLLLEGECNEMFVFLLLVACPLMLIGYKFVKWCFFDCDDSTKELNETAALVAKALSNNEALLNNAKEALADAYALDKNIEVIIQANVQCQGLKNTSK